MLEYFTTRTVLLDMHFARLSGGPSPVTVTRTTARSPKDKATNSTKGSSRDALVGRYFELQPQMQRRFSAGLRELREELHSVTVHQLGVLTFLRGQSATMRELAKELDVGESAATAVADRLVRQELVVRHDDPADRRVVRVSLSEAGETLVTKLHEAARRKTALMLAALSDEQLQQLISIMETLERSLTPSGCLVAEGRPRPAHPETDPAR
jgi:DNA-binding MarR family transcriptional regulator